MFALGLIGTMFNYGGLGSSLPSVDYLKKTLDEDEKKGQEQVYAIPTNENKAE